MDTQVCLHIAWPLHMTTFPQVNMNRASSMSLSGHRENQLRRKSWPTWHLQRCWCWCPSDRPAALRSHSSDWTRSSSPHPESSSAPPAAQGINRSPQRLLNTHTHTAESHTDTHTQQSHTQVKQITEAVMCLGSYRFRSVTRSSCCAAAGDGGFSSWGLL